MSRNLVDRGIDWLGKIPEHWDFQKGKYLFRQRSERGNNIELQLLSPTQKYGCIPQSLYEELTGATAVKLNDKTDLNLLKTIHSGDFCISLRSFQGGFEYSIYEGVVSPAYQVFYPIYDNTYRGYYKYMFKDGAFIEKMNSFTLSLRDGKNIAFADFGNTLLPVPPIEEQQAIADYLDKKIGEIDSAIQEANDIIDKYKSYKQSIITKAVTKGIIPNVSMKDSGLPWIGEIPEHWRVMPNKYVMYKVKEIQDIYNNEDILSLSTDGVKIRDLDAGGKMPTTFDGYQKIEPGRLLMCLFDIDVTPRCIGLIKDKGLTSPSYSQFIVRDNGYAPYYYYYYLNLDFDKILVHLAKNLRHSLTEDQLGAINVLVPSLPEQNAIADYLDDKCAQIDSIIESKNNLIKQLQEYKKSIIFEYVTGKKEVPNG